ncbi:MAG: HYR domain-containing protein, partial [Planctomycetes bacterium]|nr:HYR domain-containing protein [Planctomycetota bacterium]
GCDHYTITCNTLRNNGQVVSRPGVFFRDFGDGPSSDFHINTNNIVGNLGGGVMVTSGTYAGGNVDATNNWWGDPSGPFNATNNPGGLGNEVTDDVDFAPVLSQPTLVITCPSDASAECTSPAGAAVTYGSPFASSLCDASPSTSCTPVSGSTFPIGSTTVTCSAIDRTCATASCTFTVTVVDTTAPTPTCPANVTAECTSPSGAAVSFSNATAVDTCDPSPTVNCVPSSGSTFALGVTTVTCTATDAASNSSSCNFTVTVVDTTPPSPGCPANFSAVCTGPSGASVSFAATPTDICDPAPTYVCAPPSGSVFSLGPHTVNCTASDAAGNSASCSFTLTVIDINPPSITCAANQVKECTSPSGATVTYTTTAVDDCDTTPTVSCAPGSGSTFPLGTTTVNCSATDDSGNGSTCSFTVQVRDTTPPSITCSANLTRECTSPSGAAVTFGLSSVDLCDTTLTNVCTPSSGSTFPIGVTTVHCSASDDSGNTSTCSFNITVRDTTPPSITCPGTITTPATSTSGATVNYTTTAVDTCDTTPTIVCNPPSGSTFPIGSTTVTCNAADDASNTSTCSFLIRVTSGIVSVLPNSGKQTGGELVNIFGIGFTNIGDTTVLFGGSSATVVSVTSSHIQVRTPAGLGVVNVSVTNSLGTVTATNAFSYIDPSIAARFGNVNVGAGDRVDVLFINNTAGNATRDVFVPVNSPIRVDMAAAPSRVSSRYALYVWTTTPTPATLRTEFLGPYNLGCMVLPGPLNMPDTPQPRKTLNNTDQGAFGAPNFNSFPAPVTIAQRPGGLHMVRTLTLQGIIQDDASQAPSVNYAMTNAIILHITP